MRFLVELYPPPVSRARAGGLADANSNRIGIAEADIPYTVEYKGTQRQVRAENYQECVKEVTTAFKLGDARFALTVRRSKRCCSRGKAPISIASEEEFQSFDKWMVGDEVITVTIEPPEKSTEELQREEDARYGCIDC